ncbi:MAG TPA: ABC transporter permease [Chloroflexi bacterium]|nr:ABC transporter permease [Chloroflexota bacterium]
MTSSSPWSPASRGQEAEMGKLWQVARYEYQRHVRRRGFLFTTFGMPLLIIAIGVISTLVAERGSNKPLGYVDRAGVLRAPLLPPQEDEDAVPLIAFDDEAAARSALEAGQIQGYYLLPEDYLKEGRGTLYYWNDPPDEDTQDYFERVLRLNLMRGLPPDVAQRLAEGPEMIIRSPDGQREASKEGFLNLMMPYFVGILFMIAIQMSAGYLLQAVVEEKENRTMELILTSITPRQFIGGKVIGLVGVGLTQIALWSLGGIIAVRIARERWALVAAITFPWDFALVALVLFLPAYVMLAGLMTGIGAAVTELREAQQMAGLFNLLLAAPYFVVPVLFQHPNGLLALALTLFPLTAPVTMSIRWSLTLVPLWQVGVSALLLLLSAWLSVIAAARLFRAGMLRYGRRLSLRGMWQALRS